MLTLELVDLVSQNFDEGLWNFRFLQSMQALWLARDP
jgi:hypothetical protein